jgi:transcription elongation factor Elf1
MKEKEEKKVVDQGKCEICGSDKVVIYRVSLGKANKVVAICDNCLHDLYNFAKSLS